MVVNEGDTAELAHALGLAARARGMMEIARASGLMPIRVLIRLPRFARRLGLDCMQSRFRGK